MNIRPAKAEDLGFLEAMLWEAFFWTCQAAPFSAFRLHPEFTKLLSGWGRRGDWGAIAEDGGRPIGAGWFRLWTPELHSYGFVDATSSSVSPFLRLIDGKELVAL